MKEDEVLFYANQLKIIDNNLQKCITLCNELYNDENFIEVWQSNSDENNFYGQEIILKWKSKFKYKKSVDSKTLQNSINEINDMIDFLNKLKR